MFCVRMSAVICHRRRPAVAVMTTARPGARPSGGRGPSDGGGGGIGPRPANGGGVIDGPRGVPEWRELRGAPQETPPSRTLTHGSITGAGRRGRRIHHLVQTRRRSSRASPEVTSPLKPPKNKASKTRLRLRWKASRPSSEPRLKFRPSSDGRRRNIKSKHRPRPPRSPVCFLNVRTPQTFPLSSKAADEYENVIRSNFI